MQDEISTGVDLGASMSMIASIISTLIVILMVVLSMAKSYVDTIDRAISNDADKCLQDLSQYVGDIPVTQLYATLGQLQPDSIVITSDNPDMPANSYEDLRKYFTEQTSFEVESINGKCTVRLVK